MLARTLVLVLAAAVSAPAAAQDAPLSRADVETILREYLVANPEILEEAFAALQTKRMEEATSARTVAVADNREALERSPHGPVLGNPKGDVTLIEFFDYNCGYCRRAMSDLDALLAADPDLRVVLKEFPVLGEGSMKAAAVSIAVHQVAPERYFDFHRAMMAQEGSANDTVALAVVDQLAIPRAEIEAAMRSDAVRASVEESYSLAQALKLDGTPSYVIGDSVEEGAVGITALKERINIARCGQATC